MEAVIETKKLCCQAGKRYLVNNIDWKVKKGDHWILFGMNGSGKTTLLSIIAGYKKYTSGSLTIFGETYDNKNVLNLRKRIGFVSASFFDRYYHKESVLDIVLSSESGALGVTSNISNEDVCRAKLLLNGLGIYSKIYYPFQWLSKGERQNVLIARSLMYHPEILLLDEPCSGLDLSVRERLQNTVKDLSDKTDMTIIYVTHYTEEILPEFDKTLLLKQGYSWKQGETAEVFNEENLTQFFDYEVFALNGQEKRLSFYTRNHSSLYDLLEGEER